MKMNLAAITVQLVREAQWVCVSFLSGCFSVFDPGHNIWTISGEKFNLNAFFHNNSNIDLIKMDVQIAHVRIKFTTKYV